MDIREIQYDNKKEMYQQINKEMVDIVKDIKDNIANLSNASSILNVYLKDINWVGFYLFKNNKLVLGPFQGKPAVVYIEIPNGVCGTAFKEEKTIIVENVHSFCGHIACDIASRSEIVVPIFKDKKIIGVLDIDSPIVNRFDEEDKMGLEAFIETLVNYLN